jgi:hypothetical protein
MADFQDNRCAGHVSAVVLTDGWLGCTFVGEYGIRRAEGHAKCGALSEGPALILGRWAV